MDTPAGGFPHFPLFVSLAGRQAAVIGGGRIASRRVRVLLEFGARVAVVAPALCADLRALAAGGAIEWSARPYRDGDLASAALALAVTDDRAVNHAVAGEANARGIPVSVADSRAESTFYFPAVVRGAGVVAGVVSRTGASHRAVRAAAQRMREALYAAESGARGQPGKPAGRGAGTDGDGRRP